MPEDTKPSSFPVGWLIIAGIVLSFALGVFFFLTIAQERTGEPIPPPSYFVEDAAVGG